MADDYLLILCVMLRSPEKVKDESEGWTEISGYYRVLGLTAPSEQAAKSMAASLVNDGEIDWTDSTVKPADRLSFIGRAARRRRRVLKRGVWYQSGRVFFP